MRSNLWITLPMRDWDHLSKSSSKSHIYSPFWITLPMRDWDASQFMLLIDSKLIGLHYLWGIETNKNFSTWHKDTWITLPMRDWDYSISLVCEFLSWGLHYLWGIETFIAAKIWFWWILGLHYLWGIETSDILPAGILQIV